MPPAPLPAELVEFLKEPHAAVIATVRSDGAPYTAATWYDWDGGRLLVNMDFERLRLTHMRRDPRVAVTVLEIKNWYRAVSVLLGVNCQSSRGPRLVRVVEFPTVSLNCSMANVAGSTNGVSTMLKFLMSRRSTLKKTMPRF